LLTDPEFARQRVDELRHVIHRLTWDLFAESLVSFFVRVCELPPSLGALTGIGGSESATLNALLSSRTWRATAPLRRLGRRLGGS
jgi:hypothetical protein